DSPAGFGVVGAITASGGGARSIPSARYWVDFAPWHVTQALLSASRHEAPPSTQAPSKLSAANRRRIPFTLVTDLPPSVSATAAVPALPKATLAHGLIGERIESDGWERRKVSTCRGYEGGGTGTVGTIDSVEAPLAA